MISILVILPRTLSTSPPLLITHSSLGSSCNLFGTCSIDKSAHHNFELLMKIVLPDGSVLGARLPGRPTHDCLFKDPARGGTSLLMIWNLNKCSGVVGVFNCQGAGWSELAKKTRVHDTSPGTLSGSVLATDVDSIAEVAGSDWNGDAVVYLQRSGDVVMVPKGASLPVTVKVLEYEIFHLCPIMEISSNILFALVILHDIFNSCGAVDQFEMQRTSDNKIKLFDGEVPSELAIPLSEMRDLQA